MSNYILGLDGGGTKTIGRLVNITTDQQWQCTSGPSSLTNNLPYSRENVTAVCRQLLENAKCEPRNVTAVFGIAGAGNKSLVNEFRDMLTLDLAELTLMSDARTSLYGANLGQPVAVVALGTGSVGMRMLEDSSEFIVGGWGFSIGDQGSGAKLGQMAIHQALSEIDKKGETVSLLGRRISQLIGPSRAHILQWIRHSAPNEYAAIAPLIFELKDKCDAAVCVLDMHLEKVQNLINVTLADTKLPLVVLGGLAEATKSIMSDELLSRISSAKGNAVDGACILAERNLKIKGLNTK